MKNIYLLAVLLAGFFVVQAQIINFPDPNFKAKLLSANCASFDVTGTVRTNDVDTNNDGEIQISEAQAVTGLFIPHTSISTNGAITSMQGIEHFTNIKSLYCRGNQIASLDVSMLNSLTMLGCANNLITELSLPLSGSLKELAAYDNQLTNVNLAGLNQLTYLELSDNQITIVDLSTLTSLRNAVLANNPLTTVNLSANTQLEMLKLDNTLVPHIDCSNTAVYMLWAQNNPNLQTVNLRNGVQSWSDPDMLYFGIWLQNVPSLESVCIDNGEQSNLTLFNYNATGNVQVFTGPDCSVAVPMGIKENIRDLVKIFPNPAQDILNISGITDAERVTIYNAMGQMVKSISLDSVKYIDVSELCTGNYLLRLENKSGSFTQKFIKQ